MFLFYFILFLLTSLESVVVRSLFSVIFMFIKVFQWCMKHLSVCKQNWLCHAWRNFTLVFLLPRPESMVSQMQSTPKSPSVPQAHSFDMGVAEKTPSNTALQTIQSPVIDKEYMPPLAEVKCTLSQESIAVQAICLDKEESLKLTNEPTNLHNIPTDQNEQEINLATELTFSPEKTEIDQG